MNFAFYIYIYKIYKGENVRERRGRKSEIEDKWNEYFNLP